MKYSKSCDYIRKKKSRKEEVKIQVFVRIRPFLKNEKKRLLKEINENIIICKYIINLYLILIVQREDKPYEFIFNKIFKMNCNQQEIFDFTSKEIIKNVIKGYNGTIFAYGQTGSGKTYTIEGEF